jgi:hypothetical protein
MKGGAMSTIRKCMQISRVFSRSSVVVTTTGVAALAFAAAAPADTYKPVITQDVSANNCYPECVGQLVRFTTTGDNVQVGLTSDGSGNCARAVALLEFDGKYDRSRLVGPGWGQPPFTRDLAPGRHELVVRYTSLSDCKAEPAGYRATLQVDELVRAAPAPAPEAPPAPKLATVISDVDVYNQKNEPDGAGNVIGILRQGTKVQLAGTCAPSSWCQVSGPNVPGGNGWVWGHLQF